MIRIGINGLGRIGRAVIRAIYELNYRDIEVIAVNSLADGHCCAHLLNYDSIHGRFMHRAEYREDSLFIKTKKIAFSREADPKKILWDKDIDVIVECTGRFKSMATALQHTCKRVIVSAPAQDAEITIIYGVNHDLLHKAHRLISVGSCTTNCLAVIAQVLHRKIGIKQGFVTTVHAYTNDQNLVDNSHKDMRRARAAGLSIIPSTTGATSTIGKIIPELQDKISGVAIRVPTANVSMLEMIFTTNKRTSVQEINCTVENAAQNSEVLGFCTEPLVSVDFNHTRYSAVFDSNATMIVGDELCRIAAWYDNEWSFAIRILDVLKLCVRLEK